MTFRATNFSLILFSFFHFFSSFQTPVISGDSIALYTPYTKISVPPGESIDYSVEVLNNGNQMVTVPLSLYSFPRSWDYEITSGGWNISELSVLPGEKRSFTLNVDVPLKVNKGTYRFNLNAGNHSSLSLNIRVSEKGTYKSEFTSEQANMEGHANANFTFRTSLLNRTAETQLYSLRSAAPRGWNVTFKPDYKQATSVEIEPNGTKSINIEIKPPQNIEAGTYTIPVTAVTKTTSADLNLEVVITGTYKMELTTPTGLLSSDITAGGEKTIILLLRNTGSADLTDIKLSSSTPVNWEATFKPDPVELLAAGESVEIIADVKASDKAIPGDYVTKFTARTPEVTSQASFRISVKTPVLWGWMGAVIILLAIGIVYYLFRKYGRR